MYMMRHVKTWNSFRRTDARRNPYAVPEALLTR